MGLFRKRRDWYRNAVIYALDVRTFMDSNGDGRGDLQGLISKLDHLEYLGVDCLWIRPFFPSPLRDNGYDISDHCAVDPSVGTMADLEELMERTARMGMKVMIDLVLNHTSDQHPWFQNARTSRDAAYRHYYVWHEEPDHDEVKVEFDHAEESVWEYSPETGMYYLHRFYKEQPDLNLSHPDVQEEILRIMDHWIDKGICSFRVDAAHMITDPVDIENTDHREMHRLFSKMRRHLEKRIPDGVLLGEANVEPERLRHYFNDHDEGDARMHMLFNFIANKYTMLAFARRSGGPVKKGLELLRPIRKGHWVNFVRHHDELNTDQLDEHEREEVFQAFAPEPHMRALRGVRRRLPPMLGNDRRRIELMYNIMFSLPGSPLINYGEEIGMGDDLSLKGRMAVRTPMQWDAGPNGGFSTAAREELYVPVIDHGDHGHQRVNVRDQMRDKHSLLHFMKELIQLRHAHPILGEGLWQVIVTSDERAVAILYVQDDRMLLVVHNVSGEQITIRVVPGNTPGHLKEKGFWRSAGNEIDLDALELPPYGSRWIEMEDRPDDGTIA